MKASSPQPAADPRPRKRWHRRVGLLAVLLILGGIAALCWDELAPRPDLLRMRQIRPGMTAADIAAVIGARPRTARPQQLAWLKDPPAWQGRVKYWYCDAGFVEVVFDDEGRATHFKQFSYDYGGEPPAKRKVRDLLARVGLGWVVP
jgi:hypothetical protein